MLTIRYHFSMYECDCVALALCHGYWHRKLVTRFALYGE